MHGNEAHENRLCPTCGNLVSLLPDPLPAAPDVDEIHPVLQEVGLAIARLVGTMAHTDQNSL